MNNFKVTSLMEPKSQALYEGVQRPTAAACLQRYRMEPPMHGTEASQAQ